MVTGPANADSAGCAEVAAASAARVPGGTRPRSASEPRLRTVRETVRATRSARTVRTAGDRQHAAAETAVRAPVGPPCRPAPLRLPHAAAVSPSGRLSGPRAAAARYASPCQEHTT